ncbi:MAG: ABC transporter substrate-binding protein [Bacteroidaceae bacterium]|nr:ABC transporter substrate-binding protein [Bacteroidaceae bacterium]
MKHLSLPLATLLLVGVLLLHSCSQRPRSSHSETSLETDSMELRHARGFSVRSLADGIRLIDVADPQQEKDHMPVSYHFALIPKTLDADSARQQVPEGYTPVRVPVERTIVMTMLQLSNFTALEALDVVRGITGTKNLFNEDVHRRVADGRIVKIGMEGNFDAELILAANPEVIFISPFKRGGYDVIKETGITLIPHLGYKELTPLGQAEWVKFVGLFLGRKEEADSLFDAIESRYVTLRQRVQETMSSADTTTSALPTVFSGEMHGGNWYAVGGRSTLAQLFRDAGADYVIHDDNTGGVNIEFEQLYSMAAEADYWRILNSYPGDFSYEALKSSEPRNELFRAFRERRVIYCNMRKTPYYERSPMEPDVLLGDLVAIFHPELMPSDYQPTFYRLLP